MVVKDSLMQNINPRRSSVYEAGRSRTSSTRSRSVTSPVIQEEQQQEKEAELEWRNNGSSSMRVYVRCRSRNQREIDEKSSVVISTLGAHGKNVILSNSTNSLSHPRKTYTFDQVFGAESDQEIVFNAVAKDYIQEMMKGYNCTVFAYGQTGTGKTYTMSGDISILGDLESQDKILLGEHSGIIPRILVDLFKQLSQETHEYTVKVSFLELYNERLKDLLAGNDDLEENIRIFDNLSGSSNNRHKQPTKLLKVNNSSSASNQFTSSSSSSSSIMVKGMEEIYIKSAHEGLELLMAGSLKRKVAATKCNDLSSRSHTVFTITTNVARTDPVSGEQYIKIGKLNLVDLAGSENINRSGAENKRAQEAGLINKSLLTLGRVINALVDHSQHIPYRESKLTRLLQDSLGGKTKTCIIATISPAKISMDETVSTLEYAARARSIKNTPQVNQSMSKNSCIGEYIHEIERLRQELKASRQKEGIYITEDQFELYESNGILVEEQKARIQNMEEQIKRFKTKYVEQTNISKEAGQKLKRSEQVCETLQLQKTLLAESFQSYRNDCNQYAAKVNEIHSLNLYLIDSLQKERDEFYDTSTKSANLISSILESIMKQGNVLSILSSELKTHNRKYGELSAIIFNEMEEKVLVHRKAAVEEISSVDFSGIMSEISEMHSALIKALENLANPRYEETGALYSSHRSIMNQCYDQISQYVKILESSFLKMLENLQKTSISSISGLQTLGNQCSDGMIKMLVDQRTRLAKMERDLSDKNESLRACSSQLKKLQDYFENNVAKNREGVFGQIIEAVKNAEIRQIGFENEVLGKSIATVQDVGDQMYSEHAKDMVTLVKRETSSLEVLSETITNFKGQLQKLCEENIIHFDQEFAANTILEHLHEFRQILSNECSEVKSRTMLTMLDKLTSKISCEANTAVLKSKRIVDKGRDQLSTQTLQAEGHLKSVVSHLDALSEFLLVEHKSNWKQIAESQDNMITKHDTDLQSLIDDLKTSQRLFQVPDCPVRKVDPKEAAKRELPKLMGPKNYQIYEDSHIVDSLNKPPSPSRVNLSYNPSTPLPVPDQPLPKVLIPRSINSTAKRSTALPSDGKRTQFTNNEKSNNLKRVFTTEPVLKTDEEDLKNEETPGKRLRLNEM